jgi:formate-dependent nitrite reductase membrane component NrfD
VSATSPEGALSYYGRPIIKEPVWKPEIPLYFFTGGMAGAAAVLGLGARLTGNDVLARRATFVNAAAITVSPVLLIKDLGRPRLFLNMLRVFKVTSPMSVGTWIVSASGAAAGTAATCEALGVLPRVRATAEAAAGALGPFLSTYTAALVSDSVVPAWHEARRTLPFVFAAGSAASAGGAIALATPQPFAEPARRLALAGGLGELAAVTVMEKSLGDLVGEAYKNGAAHRYGRLGKAATLAGTALTAVAGRRRVGAVAGGALLMAGALCERFAVYHAGKISAADPTYTSLPQKRRVAKRGEQPATAPSRAHAGRADSTRGPGQSPYDGEPSF